MALKIRSVPEGQWATRLTQNLKKFFSITEGDELVMVTKADYNPNLKQDSYGIFVPHTFAFETDNQDEPTYFREVLWKTSLTETAPLSGGASNPTFIVQLANPPEDEWN